MFVILDLLLQVPGFEQFIQSMDPTPRSDQKSAAEQKQSERAKEVELKKNLEEKKKENKILKVIMNLGS